MSNTTTINLDNLSLTHIRLLSEICEQGSGFTYNLDIWAALVANRDRLTGEGLKDRNDEALAWMADYIEMPWDEATLGSAGYLSIAHLLDNAADGTREDPDNLFKAGEFDALARVGATFLADTYTMTEEAAKMAIYAHYEIDF